MIAAETQQGCRRLGIFPETTLAYSPYQNGNQEVFWGQVEGRLIAMLEGCKELTLAKLNEATQAWVELEYNRKVHSEIRVEPLRRYLDGKDVGRPSPSSEELRLAFRGDETRRQRRSDGTVSIEGRRFEIPSRYRHLEQVTVRYARRDLGSVHLIDGRTDTVLCGSFRSTRNATQRAFARPSSPVQPANRWPRRSRGSPPSSSSS